MMSLKKFSCVASACVLALASTQVFSVEDNAITKSVESQLRADNIVSRSNIRVETKSGVVKLTGNLKTEEEASQAIQIAQSTPGVSNVDTSKLKVEESAHPFDDTVITAKVKGLFIKDKLFGDQPISVTTIKVETTNGVVYLTGTVETAAQATTAVNLAKSVSGVSSVDSKIMVNSKSN